MKNQSIVRCFVLGLVCWLQASSAFANSNVFLAAVCSNNDGKYLLYSNDSVFGCWVNDAITGTKIEELTTCTIGRDFIHGANVGNHGGGSATLAELNADPDNRNALKGHFVSLKNLTCITLFE